MERKLIFSYWREVERMGYSSLKEWLVLPSFSYVYMASFLYLAVILIWIANSFQTHRIVLHLIFYVPLETNLNYWLFSYTIGMYSNFCYYFSSQKQNWKILIGQFVFRRAWGTLKCISGGRERRKAQISGNPFPGNLQGAYSEGWEHSKCMTCGDVWNGEWTAHHREPGKEGVYRKW